MKSFNEKASYISSYPKLVSGPLVSDIASAMKPVSDVALSPIVDSFCSRNNYSDSVSLMQPQLHSNSIDNSVDLELERIKKIELSYLTLFRKNSKFKNQGFSHFFLCQELNVNDNPANPIKIQSNAIGSNNSTLLIDDGSSFSNSSLKKDFANTTIGNNNTGSILSTESPAIYNLVFSHDGKYMASAGADGFIKIWEVISSEMDRHDPGFVEPNNHQVPSNYLTVPSRPHRKSFIDNFLDDTFSDAASSMTTFDVPGVRKSTSKSKSKSKSKSRTRNRARSDTTYSFGSNDSEGTHYVDDYSTYSNQTQIQSDIFAPIFKHQPYKTFFHDKTINSLDWSNNNFLLSSSDDGTVKLWHVDRADCLQTYNFDSIVTCAKFHKLDDRFFVASLWNGKIYLLSILEKEIIYQINLQKQVTCLEFSPKSNMLLVGCDKGYVILLKIDGGFKIEEEYQINKKKNKTGPRITAISIIDCSLKNTNKNSIYRNSKNDESNKPESESMRILISSNDSKVRLYELSGLKMKFSGLSNRFSSIAASANEDLTYIISGSEDGWTYLWETGIDSTNSGGTNDAKKKTNKLFSKQHFDIFSFFRDESDSIENKNYGSFRTNSSRCNVSVFAPRASLKLLELSNDPIFDLKHKYSFILNEMHIKDLEVDDLSTAVIITADNTGKIKVFRRDFSRYIRKALNFKSASQIVERRQTMMNRTGSEHILNKNTLVIPNYQANSAGIKHIMSSVYENPELDRGRSDTKGVIKPANKFAVESSVVDHSKEKLNLPGINIENVGGNVVVENNGVSNPDDISNEILHDKENAVLDSSDLSPIHISNSIKDIDDELKKIIGDSEQGKLAKVSQHQHSSSTASVYNVPDHENITSGTLTCSKCGSTDFNSAPMDAGNTNHIRFFCKDCGQEVNLK